MLRYIDPLVRHKKSWLPLLAILIVGVMSNFLVAGITLVFYLLSSGSNYKNQFLLLILLGTCFLASNLSPMFSFAPNFRLVVVGIALVYLFYNKNFPRSPGNYFLPFALYATFITLIYSPLGFEATIRGLAFWLMAIIIFKTYNQSYQNDPVDTSQLLLGFILLFFGINVLVLFLQVPETYLAGRFTGLMGNPNELGLLAMFCYGILDLLKRRGETGFASRIFTLTKIILVVLIILTGSRTALFGLILYEITYRLFKNKVVLLFSLVFLGLLFYLSLSIEPEEIIQSLGLSDQLRVETLTTGSGRTEVWEVAWEEIKRAPLFGKGMMYDNYFILEYGDKYEGAMRARHWYGIWNSYLSLLLDVGIIGLAAFLFAVYKMFSISNHRNLAAAFLVMAFFAGITESWMAASMNAFTPMFLLYWAVQSQPPKDPIVEE